MLKDQTENEYASGKSGQAVQEMKMANKDQEITINHSEKTGGKGKKAEE